MVIAATLLMLALAADPAKGPPPAPKPNGGGGDNARPKTASMVIEGEEPGEEPTPPVPQGEERKAIGDYIRDNSAEIRECYARRLQEKPTLQGKLVARLDIGPSGKVIGASADGINDRELVLCVVQAVRKWEFDKPQSGGKLRVAYPFKFEPQPAR
ncbi:MAG: AgmX/PglI C-terminal domain-containing protein [Myxococcales bacterium]